MKIGQLSSLAKGLIYGEICLCCSPPASQLFVKNKKTKNRKQDSFNQSLRIEVFCSLLCINKSGSHRRKGRMVEEGSAGELAIVFLKDWSQDQR